MDSSVPQKLAKKKKSKPTPYIENILDVLSDHDERSHSVPYYVAPSDAINLNNDDDIVAVLDGTETAPIYVSDYEDCSEVAIKGVRKSSPKKTTSSATSNPPVLNRVREDQLEAPKADESIDEERTEQLFEDLLAPPGEGKKKQKVKWRKSSNGTNNVKPILLTPTSQRTRNIVGLAAESTTIVATSSTSAAAAAADSKSPISAVSNDTSAALKSTTASTKTTKTQNKISSSNNNNNKSKGKFPSFGKKKNKVAMAPIDVTGMVDWDEDPILENELEEIALHGGRSGLISGTPGKGAYDLENGRKSKRFGWDRNRRSTKIKVAHKPGYRDDPSVTYIEEEDEADKSWHGPLIANNGSNKKWTKKKLIWTITKLLLVVAMVVLLVSLLVKKNGQPEPDESLTPEQQQLYDTLTRVTGPKILEDRATSQHLARQWLLYEDKEVWSLREERVIQRYALAVFHFATGGGEQHWVENNWLIGPECGDDKRPPWLGLDCNPEGEVRALVFDDWGLFGSIPPEVGHLYQLENLIIKNNPSLTGWIPATFGHLGHLRQLALYNNNLSGVIPNIFEHTKALEFINLEDNKIHGSIPLEISHLTNLETLVLRKNSFEGIIPFEQLASTSVKYLGLSYNRFSSKLERAMKEIKSLEYLYLDHNEMRGSLPDHIGELSNLRSIDLGHNHFTGEIPSEIGNMRRLEYLAINNNDFKGRLPRELGLLTNMKTLDAASNQLSGLVPSISNMVNLRNLHLYENQLTGTIPESIQQLQSIEVLFLSSNKFSGTISKEISRLSRTLRGLYLSDNHFSGSIPTQLCIFSKLEALFMDTNKLTGQIPNCFGRLTELRQLYLFQNQLIGTVPNDLQNLIRLADMGLESNNLIGEVPNAVCDLVKEKSIEVWADCSDVIGQEDPLFCSCCSVCCPSDDQCSI